MFDTIAIVGLGLLGGSIGLDLKAQGLARRVIGIARKPETAVTAVRRGACDEAVTDLAAIASADLVILATPVCSIIEMMPDIARLAPEATVTDVGSTKYRVVHAGEAALGSHFVGGHPMAGSHEGGIEAARRGLFKGATWVFTPTERTDRQALERLRALAANMDAVPVNIPLDQHDRIAAAVSHMPHLAAAAIAHAVNRLGDGDPRYAALVGGGLRDMTRLAASPAGLWRDIFATNRENTREALLVYRKALDEAIIALENDDAVQRYFEEAAAARETLIPTK